MTSTTAPSTCVICTHHNRDTPVEWGRCCDGCRAKLLGDLAQLVTLATEAATQTLPTSNPGGATGYESRPPIRLDNAAPHLAFIELTPGDESSRVTITDALTSWEIVIRSERLYARYGIATSPQDRDWLRGSGASEVALSQQAFTQAVGFLRAQIDYITSSATFPLEQFANEIAQAKAVIRGLTSSGPRDRVVACPTVLDDGTTCGRRLTVRTWHPVEARWDNGRPDDTTGETTHCRSCGAVRTATQLLHTAGTGDTYADAEALAAHFGINQTTIRKWARAGKVQRGRGLYRWADVKREVDTLRSA